MDCSEGGLQGYHLSSKLEAVLPTGPGSVDLQVRLPGDEWSAKKPEPTLDVFHGRSTML